MLLKGRRLLILSTLFLGLAFMAVLPPFEGFDEVGHYSSIRHIADGGGFPIANTSRISTEIDEFIEHGPVSRLDYARMDDGKVKKTSTEGLTGFREFFDDKDKAAAFSEKYRAPRRERAFEEGEKGNWIAVHPPLYYAFMAFFAKVADFFGMSFLGQFFFLRLVSFLLACAGMIIGFFGAARIFPKDKRLLLEAMFLLYPTIVPMFFPEFARLGNDAMCLFITGMLAAVLAEWLDDEKSVRANLAVGFCFMLGFLTKAFFIPVFAGFMCFYFLRLWRGRKDKDSVKTRLDNLFVLLLPVIFGSVYPIAMLLGTGNLAGHPDYVMFDRAGDLWALIRENVDGKSVDTALLGFIFTWQWPRTMSHDIFEPIYFVPVFVLGMSLVGLYANRLRTVPAHEALWLPFWLFVVMLLGMAHHMVMCIILFGIGNTPGWYLNILAPFIALAFAAGADLINVRVFRRTFAVLVVYSFAFLLGVRWLQWTLFSGCATLDENDMYVFSEVRECAGNVGMIIDRLGVWGWPHAALAFYALGIIFFAAGFISMAREDWGFQAGE